MSSHCTWNGQCRQHFHLRQDWSPLLDSQRYHNLQHSVLFEPSAYHSPSPGQSREPHSCRGKNKRIRRDRPLAVLHPSLTWSSPISTPPHSGRRHNHFSHPQDFSWLALKVQDGTEWDLSLLPPPLHPGKTALLLR